MANTQAMGVYSKFRIYPETELNKLPETVKGFELPFNSNSFSSKQNTSTPGTISGRRDGTEPMLGNIDASGDVVFPLDSDAFGYILAAAFGAPTTSSATAKGKYTHVFKPGTTQPSFSAEKVFSNGIYSLISGTKVNQLEMSFGGDGELTVTAGFLGCKESMNKTAAATSAENIKSVPINRFNNFQASLKIDDKDTAVVTDLSLTIPFGLDDGGYAIGSKGYRTRINEGIISPTGQLTAFFDDDSFVQKAINSTITKIQIKLEKGDDSLVIDLPEVMFARSTPSIEGATGVTQQLDYSAFYKNNALNSCIQFTLTNGIASYAFNE